MKLIDKDAVVAEIKKLEELYCYDNVTTGGRVAKSAFISINNVINSLEVKEVDLEKELDSMITPELKFHKAMPSLFDIAKHFFELGLNTQHSSINIPNIDDILEESGIDPYSKEAKIFKESYYMALEKLKTQKGEEV